MSIPAFRQPVVPVKSARPASARSAASAPRPPVPAAKAAPSTRSSLCRFTFADGRQCRTPRPAGSDHFCAFHARKLARSRSSDDLAREISFYLSGEYLSANDLSAALARLMPAMLRGDIKPKAANSLAYLGQTLTQLLRLGQDEYINAFGADTWRRVIRNSVRANFAHRNPAPQSPGPSVTQPPQNPNVAPGLQSGTLSREHRPQTFAAESRPVNLRVSLQPGQPGSSSAPPQAPAPVSASEPPQAPPQLQPETLPGSWPQTSKANPAEPANLGATVSPSAQPGSLLSPITSPGQSQSPAPKSPEPLPASAAHLPFRSPREVAPRRNDS